MRGSGDFTAVTAGLDRSNGVGWKPSPTTTPPGSEPSGAAEADTTIHVKSMARNWLPHGLLRPWPRMSVVETRSANRLAAPSSITDGRVNGAFVTMVCTDTDSGFK